MKDYNYLIDTFTSTDENDYKFSDRLLLGARERAIMILKNTYPFLIEDLSEVSIEKLSKNKLKAMIDTEQIVTFRAVNQRGEEFVLAIHKLEVK